jgi:two-component system, NarL family, nitrate/nitrite response regulator NarL
MHSPNNSSSARIIIADDHELVRESTRSMLECAHDFRILDEGKNGQEAIELCRLQRPDLVLMDVGMPRVNGFEATQVTKEELCATKVLLMSTYYNLAFASEAIRLGAEGYVLKLASITELLGAVRGVLRGESRYH